MTQTTDYGNMLYSALVYWKTTERIPCLLTIDSYRFRNVSNGEYKWCHIIFPFFDSQTAAAYRSTDWYTAAGLDKIGW